MTSTSLTSTPNSSVAQLRSPQNETTLGQGTFTTEIYTPDLIKSLINPILNCGVDTDPRTRYFACEALYNIIKITRQKAFNTCLEAIFDFNFKFYTDSDQHVRAGSHLLDSLLKEIFSESGDVDPNRVTCERIYSAPIKSASTTSTSTATSVVSTPKNRDRSSIMRLPNSHKIDISSLVPLIRTRIYTLNPSSRLLLLSWIEVIFSLPNSNLKNHVSNFVDGLLIYS